VIVVDMTENSLLGYGVVCHRGAIIGERAARREKKNVPASKKDESLESVSYGSS
jgi:hypothetical protein